MKLKIDEERAVQLFTILQDLWTRREGVFKGIVLPQDRWPLPADPVQAANYFAYAAITQRGGVVSEDPFRWVNHMRVTHPDLFVPEQVVMNYTVRDIMDIILKTVTDRKSWHPQPEQQPLVDISKKNRARPEAQDSKSGNKGTYKLDEFAASWYNNSVTLARRWNSNTLNIFDGVGEFEEAFARIDHKNRANRGQPVFTGTRRKIFSLLTIWLQEKNLIPDFPTPVPVDVHAQRVFFETGVVTAPDLQPFQGHEGTHPAHFNGRQIIRITEKVTDQIALWSQPFMVQNGFSHMAINPALWVLSRELCAGEFQNRSTGRKMNIKLLYPEVLRANPKRWPAPYDDPALGCPLAPMCTKSIPAGPYYSFGMLVLSERVPYPHPRISGSNVGVVHRAKRSGRSSRS